MSKVRTIGAVLAAILLIGSVALAQEEGNREGPRRRRGGVMGRRGRGGDLYERMQRELNLTPDQQTQLKEFFNTHKAAVQNLQGEEGDAAERREKYLKARRENDTETLEEMRDQFRKLGEGRRALDQDLNKKVLGVLTDEQKPLFQQMVIGGRRSGSPEATRIRMALRGIELTADEKKKVEEIIKKTEAAAQRLISSRRGDGEGEGTRIRRRRGRGGADGGIVMPAPAEEPGAEAGRGRRGRRSRFGRRPDPATSEAVAKLWAKAIADIKEILGEDRAAKFDKQFKALLRRGGRSPLEGLNLSEQQSTDRAKIRDDFREKIRNAEPEDRPALFKEMREAMNGVLTEEQLEQLKKQRAEHGGPRGRGGRRRRGGGEE